MDDSIAFVGLGKLGLALATCFAKRGVRTLAIDRNARLVGLLKRGTLAIAEPGLAENLELAQPNITYASDFAGVEDTDASVFLVDTPVGPDEPAPSTGNLEDAVRSVCARLAVRGAPRHHLFIIASTVLPGTIGGRIVPLIEERLGARCGEDFSVCHVPEFVALGDVIRGYEQADILLVGESDARGGDRTQALFERIIESTARVHRMSIAEAELTKISFNAFACMKISFTNFLGQLCERVPGANVDRITAAMADDRRVGGQVFLKAGPAFGGPCLPHDTRAFARVAQAFGFEAHHMKAAERINAEQHARLARMVVDTKAGSVALLGLSFKTRTPAIDESPAIHLTRALLKEGRELHVFDRAGQALVAFRREFGDRLSYHDDLRDCVRACECIVLLHADPMIAELRDVLRDDQTVIDCWRQLSGLDGRRLRALGIGLEPA